MANNIIGTGALPRVASQANTGRTQVPHARTESPLLGELLRATAPIIGSVINANQEQERRNILSQVQRSEDASITGLASGLNDIFIDQAESESFSTEARDGFEQTVLDLQDSRLRSGGKNTQESTVAFDRMTSSFRTWKDAIAQDPGRGREFELKIRRLTKEFMRVNPTLGKEAVILQKAALGQVSVSQSTGTVDQSKLINSQFMIEKYGKNFTLKQAQEAVLVKKTARDLMVTADQVGAARFDIQTNKVMIGLTGLATEDTRSRFIASVSEDPVLDKGERDKLFVKLADQEAQIIAGIRRSANDQAINGFGIVDDDEIQQAVNRIKDVFKVERSFYEGKTDLALLKRYNETHIATLQAGIGHKFEAVQKIVRNLGPGGAIALQGMLKTKDPKVRRMFQGQLEDAGLPKSISMNIDELYTDYLAMAGDPNLVKGFENITTGLALTAIKAGEVKEPVVQHAVKGISAQTKTPKDVPVAILELTSPDMIRNVVDNPKAQADYQNALRSFQSILISGAINKGNDITYDPTVDRIVVSRTSVKFPFSMLEAMRPPEERETRVTVDVDSSKALNALYKKVYSNPDLTFLPNSQDWLKSLLKATELTKEQFKEREPTLAKDINIEDIIPPEFKSIVDEAVSKALNLQSEKSE